MLLISSGNGVVMAHGSRPRRWTARPWWTNGRVVAGVITAAIPLILVALWGSVLHRDAERREAARAAWMALEAEVVGNAARTVTFWLNHRITVDGLPAAEAEQEAFRRFIAPIRLSDRGDAWIYNRDHVVFDESADFSDHYRGKSVAEIFALQQARGAAHFDDIVAAVENGTSGIGWYVWVPDKGREYAAWTSVRMLDTTWTIGLSTPESEIFALFRIDQSLVGELIGAGAITLLLLGLAGALWLKARSDHQRLSILSHRQADLEAAVTARTQELEQLNRRLLRSNQDLEQFAYAASHDLQEPLRMVSSFLGLLRTRYRDHLGDEAKEFIAFAVDGAHRMSHQINALLEYSRITTAGQDMKPLRLAGPLAVALANLRQACADADATLRLPEQDPLLLGDGEQLALLFQNLIGNALKYRSSDRHTDIAITLRPAGDRWAVQITDNGIGIAPEYQERIFRVFQRLHGRETYEGTGIGLALCKRIAERHGGPLTVESDGKTGSTFTFTLPMAPETAEDAGPDVSCPSCDLPGSAETARRVSPIDCRAVLWEIKRGGDVGSSGGQRRWPCVAWATSWRWRPVLWPVRGLHRTQSSGDSAEGFSRLSAEALWVWCGASYRGCRRRPQGPPWRRWRPWPSRRLRSLRLRH